MTTASVPVCDALDTAASDLASALSPRASQ